jgi:uncharacterized protein (TIGR02246 family)
MQKFIILLYLFCSVSVNAQSKEEDIIRLLTTQIEAWNRGDKEGFMQTYWKSDSLMFIGKSGVVKGWQKTLDNYKKRYPDTAAMGKLAFDIIQVKPLAKDYFFVIGKWRLTRSIGDLSGHYTLLLRKIKGEWKIIADHSS